MKIENIQAKVLEIVESVPFGNSDTQNRVAIINREGTPCRALRHAALRIMNRLEAMRECQYSIRRREIEIKILERDLTGETDELKRELIALDIEKKRSGDAYTQKLFKDAMREVESLWPVLQAMGTITREQFEVEEIAWYANRHGIDVSLSGDLYEKIKALPSAAHNTLPGLSDLMARLSVHGD